MFKRTHALALTCSLSFFPWAVHAQAPAAERKDAEGAGPAHTDGAELEEPVPDAAPVVSSEQVAPDAPEAGPEAAPTPGDSPGQPDSEFSVARSEAGQAPSEVPTPRAPEAAPAEPQRCSDRVQGAAPVRLVENHGAAVVLHRLEDMQWKPVCAAPCSFSAPRDPEDYALSGPGMLQVQTRRVAKDLWLAPGDGLHADYKSRKLVRAVGAGLAGLGILGFVVGFITGVPQSRAGMAAWLTSLSVAVGGGAGLTFVPDKYSLKRCIGCGRPR